MKKIAFYSEINYFEYPYSLRRETADHPGDRPADEQPSGAT